MSESSSRFRPRIGITLGDHDGIGAEILVKALANPSLFDILEPIVFGNFRILREAAADYAPEIEPLLRPKPSLTTFDRQGSEKEKTRIISLIDPVRPNTEDERLPEAAYIRAAVKACQTTLIDAMTTAPIAKASMMARGFHCPGHTEYLAELTGARHAVMTFIAPDLKVALATVHIPLREVPEAIHPNHLEQIIRIVAHDLSRWFGIESPHIAVAGLNPHAGEEGHLGTEEDRVLKPAIADLATKGYHVSGPFPADTIFLRAQRGEFDCVIAMYHDQGLIPIKLLGFGSAVNLTMGLPILRTSVDHGVAYDIAGRGIANPASLLAALNLAAEISLNVKKKS